MLRLKYLILLLLIFNFLGCGSQIIHAGDKCFFQVEQILAPKTKKWLSGDLDGDRRPGNYIGLGKCQSYTINACGHDFFDCKIEKPISSKISDRINKIKKQPWKFDMKCLNNLIVTKACKE